MKTISINRIQDLKTTYLADVVTAPANPPSGQIVIYQIAGVYYTKNSAGTITTLGAGGTSNLVTKKFRLNYSDLVALGAVSTATSTAITIPTGSILKSVTAKVSTAFTFIEAGPTELLFDVGYTGFPEYHIANFDVLDKPIGEYSSAMKSNEVLISPANDIIVSAQVVGTVFDELTAGVLDVFVEYFDANAASVDATLALS